MASRFFSWVVAAAIAVGFAVHALTLTTFPKHWLDEVHCNEMAAAFFDRDWSMNLPPPADIADRTAWQEKGPWQVFYLGSLAQEGGYRLFGHAGPRFIGFAAFILLVALVGRLFGPLPALVAFAFPPLSQSVRYGRVDVIAILFLFLAVGALRGRLPRKHGLILAGGCSAAALMSWAPAALCLPIVAWAAVRREASVRDGVRALLVCAVSGTCALVLLLAPFWAELPARLVRSYGTAVALESSSSTTLQWGLFVREFLIWAGFGLIPVAWFGCLCLAPKMRPVDWALGACSLAVAAVFLVERCYVFRVVYFAPYLILAVAVLARNAETRHMRLIALLALALTGLSYVRTIGPWTLSALGSRERCRHEDVRKSCEDVLGRGVRVYLDSLELYYVGRDLGWHAYRYSLPAPDAPVGALLDHVDWYVAEGRSVPPARADELRRHGFSEMAVIEPKPPRSALAQWTARRGRTLAYGPYVIWRRAGE